MVGTNDQWFYADEYRNEFETFSLQGQVDLIPDLTHFGSVVNEVVPPLVVQWLKRSLL